ncbi:MAG: tripartite tricarboxylate transporter substrate-binding protein, partial [Armatimonadota bacterium]|nr:tripartite tricarboxylate transporter substrate-binding protein [Armatimonadota bacterium]
MDISDELRQEIYHYFQQDMAGQVPDSVRMLERYSPGALEGFFRLRRATTTESSLPWKVRELIIIAVEAALKKDPVGHARIAIEAGATPKEIHDAVALTLWLAGMPAYHCGMKAVRAAEDLVEGRTAPAGAPGEAAAPARREGAYPWKPVQFISAAPGGGWHETCERTAAVLRAERLLPVEVNVVVRPGGLQVFEETATDPIRDDHRLVAFSPGLTMQILMKGSRYSYDDITPIAALSTDYGVIAVPAGSPFNTLGDFLANLGERPQTTPVTGGSGPQAMHHGMVAVLGAAAGIPPQEVRYIGARSVADALAALAAGQAVAGAFGAADVAGAAERGEVRVLAVLAERRLPGVLKGIPTAAEQGVEVTFPMWRGFYGPPAMAPEAVAFWQDAFRRLTETRTWQRMLREAR